MSDAEVEPGERARVILGERFGPVRVVVDEQAVRCHAFAQDHYPAGFPGGTAIAQPLLLGNQLLRVYETRYDRHVGRGALHTEEEVWYRNPVLLGERVTITGQYVDAYLRRGRPCLVLEGAAHGEDGRLLLRHRAIEAFRSADDLLAVDLTGQQVVLADREPVPAPSTVGGTVGSELTPVARAHPGVLPGTELVPLRKRLTQEQMAVFSGAGQYERNIHTDLELAREAGLARPIAQALQTAGHLAELLASYFGQSWFTGGWQRTKFIKPVLAGEELTVHGVVRAVRGTAEQLSNDLEVWVLDSAGERTAIGWASCPVRPG